MVAIRRGLGYSHRTGIFVEVGDIPRGRGYSQRSGIFVEVGIFTGVVAIYRGLGYS
jgi:hypothetical protein